MCASVRQDHFLNCTKKREKSFLVKIRIYTGFSLVSVSCVKSRANVKLSRCSTTKCKAPNVTSSRRIVPNRWLKQCQHKLRWRPHNRQFMPFSKLLVSAVAVCALQTLLCMFSVCYFSLLRMLDSGAVNRKLHSQKCGKSWSGTSLFGHQQRLKRIINIICRMGRICLQYIEEQCRGVTV